MLCESKQKYCYQTSNLITGIEEQSGEISCAKMDFISL